jgi:hypothetical protein
VDKGLVLEHFIGSGAGVQSLDLVDVSTAGRFDQNGVADTMQCTGNIRTNELDRSCSGKTRGGGGSWGQTARGFAGGRQEDDGTDPRRRQLALGSSLLLIRVRAGSLGTEKRNSCRRGE